MSTANIATSFPPCYPTPLPIRELQGSPSAVVTTPAAHEFALLEDWLASRGTLQLPLHQIETQQQTRAARCSACCFRLSRYQGAIGARVMVLFSSGYKTLRNRGICR